MKYEDYPKIYTYLTVAIIIGFIVIGLIVFFKKPVDPVIEPSPATSIEVVPAYPCLEDGKCA